MNPENTPPAANLEDIPFFEIEKWNVYPVQNWTNCYCYAVNYTNPDKQERPHINPASLPYYATPDLEEYGRVTIERAEADGLIWAGKEDMPPPKSGFYIVALVTGKTFKGNDFHWYRQDRYKTKKTVFWGHKPGDQQILAWDNSKKLILDPREADRGRYKHFEGFFHVPTKGIDLRKARNKYDVGLKL